jgi:hypothetical protein
METIYKKMNIGSTNHMPLKKQREKTRGVVSKKNCNQNVIFKFDSWYNQRVTFDDDPTNLRTESSMAINPLNAYKMVV